eukprot:3934957-Rhodomonas_salina.2
MARAGGLEVCVEPQRVCCLFGPHTGESVNPRRDVYQLCLVDGMRRKHAIHSQDGVAPDVVKVVVGSSPEIEHAQDVRTHRGSQGPI